MKASIFDKEKNDLIREEDGSVIVFVDQDEAVGYLQDEGLKDDWIKSNFVFLKRTQPLIPDVIAFKDTTVIEFYKCKNCGEEFNNENGLKNHACETQG